MHRTVDRKKLQQVGGDMRRDLEMRKEGERLVSGCERTDCRIAYDKAQVVPQEEDIDTCSVERDITFFLPYYVASKTLM